MKRPGRWCALHDHWHLNPKVQSVSLAARAVHVACITESARALSDGHLSANFVRAVALGEQALVDELVGAGLLEPNESGYHVHHYLAWNVPREAVEARSVDMARVRRGERKAGSVDVDVDADVDVDVDAGVDADVESDASVDVGVDRGLDVDGDRERSTSIEPPPASARRRGRARAVAVVTDPEALDTIAQARLDAARERQEREGT